MVRGDVSYYLRSSTEAGGSVFVALNTLPNEDNFDRHVPANSDANIKM